MRAKLTLQQEFSFCSYSRIKVVEDFVNKYKDIDKILQRNPQIFDRVHQDFENKLSGSSKGRTGDYTTEQLFRSLIVLFVEQMTYRDTVIYIDTNMVLQQFVGLGFKPVMDFTFLNKAYCALTDNTCKAVNEILKNYANEEEKISGEKLRLDCTVYEANIHYPTDSSLLWDSYRTLARLMKSIRQQMCALGMDHRFHKRKVKKLAYFISRNAGSTSKAKQRKVKSTYRKLIDFVQKILVIAIKTIQAFDGYLMGEIEQLKHYVPLVKQIVNQAQKRVFEGVILPAEEKIYSLFEEHTELIKRGKAGKNIEFGHKILVAQSGEKFITHYETFPKQPDDKDLLDGTLAAHKTLFEKAPEVLAADKGFYESRDQLKQLSEDIKVVSIGKKGSRTAEEKERETSKEFKEGQRFRAGSEGSISVLKRAFNLEKCFFKGYKNFAVSVGCAVFCHNLVLLTRL